MGSDKENRGFFSFGGRFMGLLAGLYLALMMSAEGASPRLADAPSPPSSFTLEQICSGYHESRSRIRSLKIDYEILGKAPLTGTEQRLRREIAAQGRNRYAQFIHVEAGYPEDLDLRQCRVYYTGETLDVFFPLGLYFETSRKNVERQFADKVRAEFFYECSGWWPPDDDSQPPHHGTPPYPHEVLARPDCRVLPSQEPVDGHWCHVVQVADVEKLWFDAAIGFALRRRDLYEAKSERPTVRYELSDFRENPSKTWMPWRLRRLIHGEPQAGSTEPSIKSDTLAVVRKFEVNQVPADLFQFTPPAGTLVQDRDTKKTWQIPGGLSFLDTAVEIARRRGTVFASAHGDSFPRRSRSTGPALLMLALVSVTLAQTFRVLQRR